jgi:hypothetical protein
MIRRECPHKECAGCSLDLPEKNAQPKQLNGSHKLASP